MQAAGAIGGADVPKLMATSASAASLKDATAGTFLQSLQAFSEQARPVSTSVQAKISMAFAANAQQALGDAAAKQVTMPADESQLSADDAVPAKSVSAAVAGAQQPAVTTEVNSLTTIPEAAQKLTVSVEHAKPLEMSTGGVEKRDVVTGANQDTNEQRTAISILVMPVSPVRSSRASGTGSRVTSEVVAQVSGSDAKTTRVAALSDGDASAKVALKAHEEPHMKGSQGAGPVVVAKKSPRKDDASASDAQIAPLTVEAGAPTQQLGQPLAAVSIPIVAANDRSEDAIVTGAAGVSLVSQAGLLNAPKTSSPATAKPALRDTKKVDDVSAIATPQTKVETVAVSATTAVQTHTDSVQVTADASRSLINAIAPAHATHSATSTVSTKVADVTEVTLANSGAVSQANDAKTLIATPNVLEVGIASGSHGWLRVRAELGQMGEVTASVAAASAGAAEGLHRELPALSAYLAEEQVGVNSLVVHATVQATGTLDGTLTSNAGTQSGTEAGTGRREQHTPYSNSGEQNTSDVPLEASSSLNLDFVGAKLPAAVYANGSGSWLSVRV